MVIRPEKVNEALAEASELMPTERLAPLYQEIVQYIKFLEDKITRWEGMGMQDDFAPTTGLMRGDLETYLGEEFANSLSDDQLANIAAQMVDNDSFMTDWFTTLEWACEYLYPDQFIPWNKRKENEDEG